MPVLLLGQLLASQVLFRPAPLQFDLQPGAELRIVNRVGASVCQLELRTRSGLLLLRRELGGNRGDMVRLPPGVYEAEIVGLDGQSVVRTITLPPEGAVLTVP